MRIAACVRYGLDSDGCMMVESKDEMKRRLGHSPDLADGLSTTFAPVAPALGVLDMTRALEGLHTPSSARMPGASTRPRFGRRIFADEYEDL